jgi:RecA-family ATPase
MHVPAVRVWQDRDVVPGLLRPGLSLLTGASFTGKSWLALQLAVAVAGGCRGQVQGLQAGALYLAPEDNCSRLAHRLRLIAAPADAPLHFGVQWPALDEGGLYELGVKIESIARCRLVVVDTLTSALGGDLLRDAAGLANLIDQLRILAVTHDLSLLLVDRHRFPDSYGRIDAVDLAFREASRRRLFDRTLTLLRGYGQRQASLVVSDSDRPFTLQCHPDLRPHSSYTWPAQGQGVPL